MGFGEAVRSVFSKYFQFSGRSRRSEYWYFVLFNFIVAIVLGVVDNAAFKTSPEDVGPLGLLFTIATLIPGLAVGVRRLHDTNRSGWWLGALYVLAIAGPIYFVSRAFSPDVANGSAPMLGLIGIVFLLAILAFAIVLLVWFCTKGTAGPNQYGPDPTQAEDTAQVFS